MYTFRPRQEECLTAIDNALGRGVKGQAIVAATGFGKSVVMAEATRRFGRRTLVLDHRDELTTQNSKKLAAIIPTAYIGREDGRSGPCHGDEDIVVGSVQSLSRDKCKRLRRLLQYRPFDLLQIDELHHVASRTYQDVVDCCKEYNPDLMMIGWTATPKRTDKKPLKGFDEVVFHYSLRQAIEEGWLVDIEAHRIITKVDLDGVPMKGGDFVESKLSKVTNTKERNSLIVNGWLDHSYGLQTLVFCVDVQHVRDLTDLFCNNGVRAEMIVGESPQFVRDSVFGRFRDGSTTVLVNCMVASEGTDLPMVQSIILGRPTGSQLIQIQQAGRGGRTNCNVDDYDTIEGRKAAIAASTKPVLRLFDVVDNCTKHSLVMAPDIFGIPKTIKLRKTTLAVAAKQLEEAQAVAPSLDIGKVKDIEQLQKMVTEALRIKIWDIEPPQEVKDYSTLTWSKVTDGSYHLPVSKHEIMMLSTNAIGQTEAMLRSDADFNGEVWTKREVKYEALGHADSIEEAFRRADAYVENNFDDALIILKQRAKWHKDMASAKQVTKLKLWHYNVKEMDGKPMVHDGNGWLELNKGLASRLITKKIQEFKEKV